MGTSFRKAFLPRRYHVDLDGTYVGWVYKVNDHRWRAYIDPIISDLAAETARTAGTLTAASSDKHRTRADAAAWIARTAPTYLETRSDHR